MVVESIRTGELFLKEAAEERPERRAAATLLEKGEYEPLIDLLGEAQAKAERAGDPVLARVLAAAHQLCLTCSQYHAEVESYAQAYEASINRERVFRQQLHDVLSLIEEENAFKTVDKRVVSFTHPMAAVTLRQRNSPELENHTLWRRVQGLWERRPDIASLRRESPGNEFDEVDTVRMSPLIENGEAVAFLRTAEHEVSEKPTSLAKAPVNAVTKGPTLAVYCFGSFRVFDDGQLVDSWNGNKCKSVFKYLVTHREQPIHREILMDLFWPDEEPEAARRNLYQAIYMMRQALQNSSPDFSHVLCEDSCYGFNPEMELWVDSEAFDHHYQTGLQLENQGRTREAIQEYEAADSLYEGEFLAEDIYEEWTLIQRENLKHAHLDILDRLSQHYWRQEQFSLCVTYCQKILYEDSCREDAHRRLMLTYLRQGQRHLALRQYHRCVEALQQELGVSPMPATVELYQKIQDNRVQFPDL